MPTLTIPEEIREAVAKGAVLAVSISGGKDSQALLKVICDWYRSEGLGNKLFAIHADLGRSEWQQTPGYVEKLCRDFGIELVVVRAQRDGKDIDLLDRMRERLTQLEEQGKELMFFPSARARYCTSDLKTKPINDYLNQFEKVVSIEGICWHESQARSQKPRVEVRKKLSTYGRTSYTWNAIIDYSLDDVWGTFGQSVASHRRAIEYYEATGIVPDWWNFHPVYAMGNTRLSCSICILANKNYYLNGIKHNPSYAQALHELESYSGYTIRQGMSIADAWQLLKQTKI